MSIAPGPTKALILARGLGTRMRATASHSAGGTSGETAGGLTDSQASIAALGLKAMMPLGDGAGYPFIAHVLTALADAGFSDVCLVIGPEHALVREWFSAQPLRRLHVSFAEQTQALGTADAVASARSWAGEDRFIMVNSDNYYPVPALRALREAPGTAALGFEAETLTARSNSPPERVAAFALMTTNERGHLDQIVEKPSPAQRAELGGRARVSMNCFCFGPSVFEACGRIEKSPRGEYEIVDAVRALQAMGEQVTVVPVAEGVLDMSGRGDVAAVSAALAHSRVVL